MALEETDAVEYMMEMAKHQGGCSAATVKDGHIIMLSTRTLEHLLEQAKNSKQGAAVVFIKRPDMA